MKTPPGPGPISTSRAANGSSPEPSSQVMQKIAAVTIFEICAVCIVSGSALATDYELYFLGGQSNMVGYGRVEELPAHIREPVNGAVIFHGNDSGDGVPRDGRGAWHPLVPGHGEGFRFVDGKNHYSARFGVEITFARQLRKRFPKANIALIKYARNATALDAAAAGPYGSWDPEYSDGKGKGKGVNQFDHFLATVRNAFAVRDVDGDGLADRLLPRGIVWMQGESDAYHHLPSAKRYKENLKRFLLLARTAFWDQDLPVAIGLISDSGAGRGKPTWKYGSLIRRAQRAVAKEDPLVVLVDSTEGYRYSDRAHYDTKGYLDLGRQFADALIGLQRERRFDGRGGK